MKTTKIYLYGLKTHLIFYENKKNKIYFFLVKNHENGNKG